MPITTPAAAVRLYGNDADHFAHVFEYLFTPALHAAGYEVVPPSASGSDLIHAEIIRQLEQADLVLCDMSGLNPNVFFEGGIRTALDRPIAMVMDTVSPAIPFDMKLLNCHLYEPSLAQWHRDGEIDRLAAHVTACARRSHGRNTLWKQFGLTARAHHAPNDPDRPDDKLDLIITMLSAQPTQGEGTHLERFARSMRLVLRPDEGAPRMNGVYVAENRVLIDAAGPLGSDYEQQIRAMAKQHGVRVEFRMNGKTTGFG